MLTENLRSASGGQPGMYALVGHLPGNDAQPREACGAEGESRSDAKPNRSDLRANSIFKEYSWTSEDSSTAKLCKSQGGGNSDSEWYVS